MDILNVKYQLQGSGYFVTFNDGSSRSVPLAPGNRHYSKVQDWIDEGNTPEPAESGAETTDRLSAEVRDQRDRKLAATDFTQLNDAPFDPTSVGAWKQYRADLRNLPNLPGFPETVVWPVPPA